MKKAERAVSVIGGVDGATSVWVVGNNNKNLVQRWKHKVRKWVNHRRRIKAMKMIVPGTHSLQETFLYMKNKYNAYEADETYPVYDERKNQLRLSLIQAEKPYLIHPEDTLTPPENMEDRKALEKWVKDLEEWNQKREEKAKNIPYEQFPIEYHLYVMRFGEDGKIEIEAEETKGIAGASCSGNIKKLRKVLQDIYMYYGVSEQDIKQKTPRYNTLVAELARI